MTDLRETADALTDIIHAHEWDDLDEHILYAAVGCLLDRDENRA